MKVEKRNGNNARLVLTRMLLDPAVLGPVAARWDDRDGLFGSRGENLVGGWAVAHYRKHRTAPGRAVTAYFDRWAEHQRDDEVEDYVSTVLQGLDDESRKNGTAITANVVLDVAGDVFNKVRQERLTEEVASCHSRGDTKKAEELIAAYRRVEIGQDAVHDVYAGGAFVQTAIESAGRALIEWDQKALRKFFGSMLGRGQFIVFTGIEKVGKSWWLQEAAFQAVKNKLRVALFEIGDQTAAQIHRRLISRAAGRPIAANDVVHVPVAIVPSDDGMPTVETEVKSWPKNITTTEADDALYGVEKKYGKDLLRLSISPNFTMTVPKMAEVLEDWKREGWVADVVVLDYADLLAPTDGRAETREQINQNWKMLRAINQRLDCLLVTATQSDADGYYAKTLDMGNFSEDKRKNAHCTGNVAINQTKSERQKGVYRLTWMYGRDLDIRTDAAVYTAPCLAVANPAVFSCF